jgi:DNA-binding SARP family transcriptional activator/tetratricopeptide (TPR) repeat protein
MGAHVEFGILGPTELIENGRTVSLGPAKQRGMLAALLYHAGEPVRTDSLISLLWYPPGTADHRPTLYSLASRLRAVLAQVGLDHALTRVPGAAAYRLDVRPDLVDVHRFRRALAEARAAAERGEPESAVERLQSSLQLWRGEPLAELRGPSAERVRGSLNQAQLDAHRLLAECRLACGRGHDVLVQLESMVMSHDLDEGLARCWVQALRAAGRHDEAKQFATVFRRRFRRAMRAEPEIDIPPNGRPRAVTERTPRQLPPDIGDFTGRETLLDELTGNSVVVISGMPGVGKTTLATHWAHRRRVEFTGGQLYLDAGAYGAGPAIDPEAALDRFLRALGLPPDQMPVTIEQRRDRFEELIGDRRVLLLIDNVLSSAQVRPLIPRSANCLTIITSRIRLSGLTIRDGVRTVVAGPLSEEESAELLARIIGPRAATERIGLGRLARLSEGLPLAVRIIGERVAERPRAGLGELAEELHDRLLDATDGDDQTASLTTVFHWSYRALDEAAARLFRTVSIHPGTTISPEAAAAAAGAPVPDVEILLDRLARAHMINHDTARRYRFHSLLRRYAARRAAAEDDAENLGRARRRLLDWFLLSAAGAMAAIAPEWPPVPDLPNSPEVRPMGFRTDAEAMKWCDAERDNLVALSGWAGKHGFHRHGWQIPGVVHEMFERHGSTGDVLRLNRQALEAARMDGHEVGQIGTMVNLGTTHFALHDYDRALQAFAAARQLAAAHGHAEEETICLHNLAVTYVSLGQVRQAVEIYRHALDICRRRNEPAGEAATLHWLGEAHFRMGELPAAAEHFQQALALRQRIGSKRGAGQTHSALAALYLAMNRPKLALRHGESALALHVQSADQRAECGTLITLAAVQRRLGRLADAIRNGSRALALSEQIPDSFRQVEALIVVGEALAASGDRSPAVDRFQAAGRLLDDLSGVHVPPLRERLAAAEKAARLPSFGRHHGWAEPGQEASSW